MSKKKKPSKPSAQTFLESWSDNEEHMGEWAAFHVTCEQFEIEPDAAFDILAAHPAGQVIPEIHA